MTSLTYYIIAHAHKFKLAKKNGDSLVGGDGERKQDKQLFAILYFDAIFRREVYVLVESLGAGD